MQCVSLRGPHVRSHIPNQEEQDAVQLPYNCCGVFKGEFILQQLETCDVNHYKAFLFLRQGNTLLLGAGGLLRIFLALCAISP